MGKTLMALGCLLMLVPFFIVLLVALVGAVVGAVH